MIFKTKHLPRYRDIARLFWRHGRSEVFRHLGDTSELRDPTAEMNAKDPTPEELVDDLERMGPTFIKLGQVLSSRSDLLPPAYLKALTRLQDKVEPFPFEQVEEIVHHELGVRISKAFLEFDEKPLAAASLGQVHRAVLRDGRKVAVKVQRPGIRKQIAEDLEVLEEIATFAEEHTKTGQRHHLREVLEQFRKSLAQELDYEREADHLNVIGEHLKEFPRIRVAQPIMDYTARAVLTMTYLDGCKITDISPVVRLDLDGAELADELFRAYLKQILVDGIFHADPHPGNIFITSDLKIGLLDLGMVGRLTPGMQETLLKLLLAVSEGRAEDAADVSIRISQTADDFNEPMFRRFLGDLVARMQDNTLTQIDVGRVLLEVGRVAGETGLFVPSELTMLSKTLLQLYEIGRCLQPEFNPNEAVRRHVTSILKQRLKKDFTPGNFFTALLDVKEFAGQLPSRVGKILDTISKGQIELRMRSDDTLRVLDGFQKVANRIAAGVVLAALIVGAALLMQVRTAFTIFGYPGFAMLCFIAAGAGGCWLLFDILWRDLKGPKKPKPRG
ncbi:MAG TPA: AarF/UbiB family protein [Desulfuromonadaceae bacterium]|nr:AarF/UbiB family protein [Desulfuromonadaceae bacterium]